MRQFGRIFIETIGLQSARGRLVFFMVASTVIFFLPSGPPINISVWQRLGFDWAPSIGLTRAYGQLLHLNFEAAWQQNPLIYAVIAVGMPLLAADAAKVMKKRATSSEASPIQ